MKRILFTMLLAASLSAEAQTQRYETEFARPLNEVLTDIQNRFGVRLKYDIDTVGKVLSYADFQMCIRDSNIPVVFRKETEYLQMVICGFHIALSLIHIYGKLHIKQT